VSAPWGTPGSSAAWRSFEWVFQPWLRRQLAGIEIRDVGGGGRSVPEIRSDYPVILVANHTSWFDGFLLREVHRRIRPGAPLRSVMLDRELRRNPVLRWIGGTGFDPGHPQTLRSAIRALAGLRSEGVVVSYFPQGHIFPASRRPLGFRPGIDLLARQMAPVHVVPVALHLEMANRVRPTAWIVQGQALTLDCPEVGTGPLVAKVEPPLHLVLEGRVTQLLDHLFAHLHTHGEGAHQAPWSG